MTDRASAEGLEDIILNGGLRLPGFDHWRERVSSKPSDPDDVRWDCVCGYSGSPEKVLRHWRALRSSESDSGLDDYHRGYADGESSCMADWIAALQDVGGWPDDVEVTPTAVALRLSTPRTETSEP